MYVMNITGDYDSFTNCTDNENDDKNIILKFSLSKSQDLYYYYTSNV